MKEIIGWLKEKIKNLLEESEKLRIEAEICKRIIKGLEKKRVLEMLEEKKHE